MRAGLAGTRASRRPDGRTRSGLGAAPRLYPRRMLDRLPAPGPSYLREQEVRIADRVLRAGMSRPGAPTEDWWTAILWVADDDGVVPFRDVAPAAGPPPDPPLGRLGPALDRK